MEGFIAHTFWQCIDWSSATHAPSHPFLSYPESLIANGIRLHGIPSWADFHFSPSPHPTCWSESRLTYTLLPAYAFSHGCRVKMAFYYSPQEEGARQSGTHFDIMRECAKMACLWLDREESGWRVDMSAV